MSADTTFLHTTSVVDDIDLGDDCVVRVVNGRLSQPRIPESDRYVKRAAVACAQRRYRVRSAQIAYVTALFAMAKDRIRGLPVNPVSDEVARDLDEVVAGYHRDEERRAQAMARYRELVAERAAAHAA